MTILRIKKTGFLVALLLLFWTPAVQSAITTFDDEAAYISALTVLVPSTFTEGFEGEAWALPWNGAPSVSSQGITWTAGHNNVMTGVGWKRSGDQGVFVAWDGHPDPSTIMLRGTSDDTLIGFGGWFRGQTDVHTLSIEVDGVHVSTWDFPNTFGVDGFRFFGVVDTGGFSTFSLTSYGGMWGADDFTFGRAAAPIPEPTSLAIWSAIALGGLGLAYRRRKRTA